MDFNKVWYAENENDLKKILQGHVHSESGIIFTVSWSMGTEWLIEEPGISMGYGFTVEQYADFTFDGTIFKKSEVYLDENDDSENIAECFFNEFLPVHSQIRQFHEQKLRREISINFLHYTGEAIIPPLTLEEIKESCPHLLPMSDILAMPKNEYRRKIPISREDCKLLEMLIRENPVFLPRYVN